MQTGNGILITGRTAVDHMQKKGEQDEKKDTCALHGIYIPVGSSRDEFCGRAGVRYTGRLEH